MPIHIHSDASFKSGTARGAYLIERKCRPNSKVLTTHKYAFRTKVIEEENGIGNVEKTTMV